MRSWLVLGALGVLAFGCVKGGDNGNSAEPDTTTQGAAKKGQPPATEPDKVPATPDKAPDKAPDKGEDTAMGDTIQLKGLASVEHAKGKGSFTAYNPERPVPTPIKEGDRLRVRLQGADKAWVYAVAAEKQEEFWKMGAWKPGEGVKDGVRMLWPGGHILTAQEAEMTTMFVIASTEELPWARDLKTEDTSALVGKMPPDPPKTAADHLYGLFWKVPGRVRGMKPPPVEFFWVDDKEKLPAIVTSQTGSPYAAVEWLFKPRK